MAGLVAWITRAGYYARNSALANSDVIFCKHRLLNLTMGLTNAVEGPNAYPSRGVELPPGYFPRGG